MIWKILKSQFQKINRTLSYNSSTVALQLDSTIHCPQNQNSSMMQVLEKDGLRT